MTRTIDHEAYFTLLKKPVDVSQVLISFQGDDMYLFLAVTGDPWSYQTYLYIDDRL